MQSGTIPKIVFWLCLGLFSIWLITLPPQIEKIPQKEQSVGTNYNWGWSDDYCLKKIKYPNGSIIMIPRCKF